MRTPKGDYRDTLLSLKEDVWFFFIKNENTVLGKIFYDRSRKRHASPNKTASMLLYLLARDLEDDIHFDTIIDLMSKKFKDVKTEAAITPAQATEYLNAFLEKCELCFNVRKGGPPEYGILNFKDEPHVHKGTPVPDPMELFEPPLIPWETPNINAKDSPVIFARSHFYASPEDGVNGGTIKIPPW